MPKPPRGLYQNRPQLSVVTVKDFFAGFGKKMKKNGQSELKLLFNVRETLRSKKGEKFQGPQNPKTEFLDFSDQGFSE